MNKQTIKATKVLTCEDINITAVAAFKNMVFVAGYGDKLVVYKCTNDDLQSAAKPTVYENYFGCKTSAEEMIVDPRHEILLCRTRKGVYCVDINNITLKSLLKNTEKSQCMSLHPDCTKLCISARKKTLIFTIHDRAFSLDNTIPSKETPMSMDWIDESLFVGCKIAYYLQDVEKGAITRTLLTKAAKTWTSMVASSISSHSECLLLDSDNTIVMVDKFGNPTHAPEELICITTQPTQLSALSPYFFVLVSNFLYVYNIASLERIQKIPLQGKFRMTPNAMSLPDDRSLFLFSDHNIYILKSESPRDQIKELLTQSKPLFDDAINIALIHDLPEEEVRALHLQYGYYLFSCNLFDEAELQFTQAKVALEDVIGLYHELAIPGVQPLPENRNPYPVPVFTPTTRRRAYEALVEFLKKRRPGVQQDDAIVIDHALVFAMIALQAEDPLRDFLLKPNHCDVKLVEERLVNTLHSMDSSVQRMKITLALLFLFEGKNMYKRAVEVVLYQLQHCRTASPERTELLKTFTRVLFGLDIGDEQLVFKCGQRIYAEAPDLLMRCFINDQGLVSTLNIFNVIKYLRSLTKALPTPYQRNKFALDYLTIVAPCMHGQSRAMTISTTTMEFNLPHLLAVLSIETIADLYQASKESPERQENEKKEAVPRLVGEAALMKAKNLQEQLRTLLRTNQQYVAEDVLAVLPDDRVLFGEERCILLARLQRHAEALEYLLQQQGEGEGEENDYTKVYQYCDEVAKREMKKGQEVHEVYVTLLEVLFRHKVDMKIIYSYIDRYHHCLPPEKVLEMIPDDADLFRLYPYFAQIITSMTETMYQKRMKYNLMMSEYVENKHTVAMSRQKGVEIGEETVCAKCGKPLGTTAVMWVSDQELYHYSCCEMEGTVLLLKDKKTGFVERVSLSDSQSS